MLTFVRSLEASNIPKSPEHAVDHLVIGGGIVGLAIARELCQTFPHKSTYLVERNASAGQETR
jgi:2-hydroxyglutarate dehydrogenase